MGKLNLNSTNQKNIINVGTSLMVVVLIGLSFAVIAALSVSSAKANNNLSEQLKEHTTDYYEACNAAYDYIDENGWKDQKFEIPMGEKQLLAVEIVDGEIVRWQVVTEDEWSAEDTLPVHIN